MFTTDAREVILTTLKVADLSEPFSKGQLVDLILADLAKAGVVVLNQQDIEWGKCPGNTDEVDGPHRVSLSLCAWCLEYDPE